MVPGLVHLACLAVFLKLMLVCFLLVKWIFLDPPAIRKHNRRVDEHYGRRRS